MFLTLFFLKLLSFVAVKLFVISKILKTGFEVELLLKNWLEKNIKVLLSLKNTIAKLKKNSFKGI